MPESSRKLLEAHAARSGQCVAGCGQWPCDTTIAAMTEAPLPRRTPGSTVRPTLGGHDEGWQAFQRPQRTSGDVPC